MQAISNQIQVLLNNKGDCILQHTVPISEAKVKESVGHPSNYMLNSP